MKQTTSRSEARAALLKRQATAAEERKRREIKNVSDLTTFVVETAKLDGVDGWERSRLQKVREDADARGSARSLPRWWVRARAHSETAWPARS